MSDGMSRWILNFNQGQIIPNLKQRQLSLLIGRFAKDVLLYVNGKQS